MKYVLTENTKIFKSAKGDVQLFQIRALHAIPEKLVRAGELGGWIESENNLSQEGSCWLDAFSIVCNGSVVSEDAFIKNTSLENESFVSGRAQLQSCTLSGKGSVIQGFAVLSDVHVSGMLDTRYHSVLIRSHIEGSCIIEGDHCEILHSRILGSVKICSPHTHIHFSILSHALFQEGHHKIIRSTLKTQKGTKVLADFTCSDSKVVVTNLRTFKGARTELEHVSISLSERFDIYAPVCFRHVRIDGDAIEARDTQIMGQPRLEKDGDTYPSIDIHTGESYFESTFIEGDILIKGEWRIHDSKLNGCLQLLSETHYPSVLKDSIVEECAKIHIPKDMPKRQAVIHSLCLNGDNLLDTIEEIEKYAV